MWGGVKRFDYSNFEEYLADPIEYRFIDYAESTDFVAWGAKQVSSLDWYFRFDDLCMPVGFLMEAIMQTGVLIISRKDDIQNPLMMFNGCKLMNVYQTIRPGSKLETFVELRSFRNGVANYNGKALVAGELICDMRFTLIHPDELDRISSAMSGRKES